MSPTVVGSSRRPTYPSQLEYTTATRGDHGDPDLGMPGPVPNQKQLNGIPSFLDLPELSLDGRSHISSVPSGLVLASWQGWLLALWAPLVLNSCLSCQRDCSLSAHLYPSRTRLPLSSSNLTGSTPVVAAARLVSVSGQLDSFATMLPCSPLRQGQLGTVSSKLLPGLTQRVRITDPLGQSQIPGTI